MYFFYFVDDFSSEDTFRIHLFGDSNVGKTSLLLRFMVLPLNLSLVQDSAFDEHVRTTIGLDYREKLVAVKDKVYCITLVFILAFYFPLKADTAGQEKFRALTKRYYTQTDAAIIVFETTCFVPLFYFFSFEVF